MTAAARAPLAEQGPGIVLIVDDAPENLAMLHEALDAAGYRVLVATNGHAALERIALLQPDVVLLDAIMPGLDGFETCRRLKADPLSAHIPVVFMTGLCETGHILTGFEAGGVDYLTKPIKPPEVLARIATHVRNARQTASARQAVDATGHAMLSVDVHGRVRWQSPAASDWLRHWLDADAGLPAIALAWLTAGAGEALGFSVDGRLLSLSRLAGDGIGTTLLLQKRAGAPEPPVLAAAYGLTGRESEVLYWVAYGKINRDVGEILGMSPRTVDKHLQHVFEKLNVETRTAAASMVLKHVPSAG
ncbi:MAG: response regulator transcription factor [Rhizobacter sp.]|nr:response regulator transcription factor [Rhizobacter sp.]